MSEKPEELGALWIKHGKNGEYLSGMLTIDGVATPIVCFTNQHKKNEKQPDWRILRSQPRAQVENNVNNAVAAEDITPEDIPF